MGARPMPSREVAIRELQRISDAALASLSMQELLNELLLRIAAILSARTNLRSLAASVDEIETALAGTDETGDGPGRTFERLRRGVVLDDVSVRYPLGERPALRSIAGRAAG